MAQARARLILTVALTLTLILTLTRSDGCAASGGKGFVDALFEFSEPLGAAYTGAWRNGFTFEIVIADAANASLGVRSDRFVGSEVATHLWAVPGSATSQAVARGDFRETIGAPPLGL